MRIKLLSLICLLFIAENNFVYCRKKPTEPAVGKLYALSGVIPKVEDVERLFLFQAIGLQEMNRMPISIKPDRKTNLCTPEQLKDYRAAQRKEISIWYPKGNEAVCYGTKKPLHSINWK